MVIKGTFTIRGTPLTADPSTEHIGAGRMRFDKIFSGELNGTSVVEMIGLMDQQTASGGYVAMERFTGSLAGRTGSFVLQHSSTMDRGAPDQRIGVVPGSGTGELRGLRGSMLIDVVDKLHHYTFDYSLGA